MPITTTLYQKVLHYKDAFCKFAVCEVRQRENFSYLQGFYGTLCEHQFLLPLIMFVRLDWFGFALYLHGSYETTEWAAIAHRELGGPAGVSQLIQILQLDRLPNGDVTEEFFDKATPENRDKMQMAVDQYFAYLQNAGVVGALLIGATLASVQANPTPAPDSGALFGSIGMSFLWYFSSILFLQALYISFGIVFYSSMYYGYLFCLPTVESKFAFIQTNTDEAGMIFMAIVETAKAIPPYLAYSVSWGHGLIALVALIIFVVCYINYCGKLVYILETQHKVAKQYAEEFKSNHPKELNCDGLRDSLDNVAVDVNASLTAEGIFLSRSKNGSVDATTQPQAVPIASNGCYGLL